jgi:malonate transporter and related proteins
MAMVDTILGALAPIVVTLLLGFVAAWRHDFPATDVLVLNRMALQYAVPVTRFVSAIGTPRADRSDPLGAFAPQRGRREN